MANPWFRLYSEFATDPKVQMMSEADQRRFIMLLCLRCGNGEVTLHDEEIAFQLRISAEEWAQTKALFLSKGLINDDSTPAKWESRQFVSDSSAARVRRHRENKKRSGNVTVTPPDTDTDTDTEKHITPARRRAQKTPVPDDFDLTDHRRSLAIKHWSAHHRPDLSPEDQFQKFLAHHRSKGSVMADWDSAWVTWYSNAKEFSRPRTAGPKGDDLMAGVI